jgi:hypothetical protein
MKSFNTYTQDIIDIEKLYKEKSIINEGTIPITKSTGIDPSKRKKMEKLIYDTFEALDPSGENKKKYKEMFSTMSNIEFDKFFKKFFEDENLYLILDVIEYERDLKMENIEKAAKILDLELFEDVAMPFLNGSIENPVVTPVKVPVGYLHLKPMQQLVSKKNTTSTNINERSSLTNQVTGKDKNARDTDTENISLVTIGANYTLKELLGPRSDDSVAKAEMYSLITKKGYVSLSELTDKVENKTTLNTIDTFLIGMGIKSDLITDGLILTKTLKTE